MGLLSGLFGGGGQSSGASEAAIAAGKEYAKPVYFRPFTMYSGSGFGSYDPSSGQMVSGLAPQFAQLQDISTAGASNIFSQLGSTDLNQRASDIFKEQAALLDPEFERQATQLQSQLFGGGRLGMRLAGEGAGAGSGVMVQPDAFGLQRSQQQTLAELSAASRAQALEESKGLSAVAKDMSTTGLTTAALENELMRLGMDVESARALAAASAGQIAMAPYQAATQAAMQRDTNQSSLFGGLLGAAATAYFAPTTGGGFVGGPF